MKGGSELVVLGVDIRVKRKKKGEWVPAVVEIVGEIVVGTVVDNPRAL